MTKIVVFGNSGSGKSTLAKRYSELPGVAHLDLDTVAWKAGQPGVREDLAQSEKRIEAFISDNENWVIEGCYASLLSIATNRANEIIFLNPGTESCQDNCRARPWEPHKYESKVEQDKNLNMLLNWVAEYETRADEFSHAAHRELFQNFHDKKREVTSNKEARNIASGIAVS